MSLAPDLVRPVIGFRAWRLTHRGALYPLTGRSVWTADVNQAQCEQGETLLPHKVPDAECSCGLYAYHTPEQVQSVPYYQVEGAVQMWGTCEVHCDGVRAQYARVIALQAPSSSWRQHPVWKLLMSLVVVVVSLYFLQQQTLDHLAGAIGWFAAFAMMLVPVGWYIFWIDVTSPRRRIRSAQMLVGICWAIIIACACLLLPLEALILALSPSVFALVLVQLMYISGCIHAWQRRGEFWRHLQAAAQQYNVPVLSSAEMQAYCESLGTPIPQSLYPLPSACDE